MPHPLAGGGAAAGAGRIARCLEPTELLLQLEGSGMVHSHNACVIDGIAVIVANILVLKVFNDHQS